MAVLDMCGALQKPVAEYESVGLQREALCSYIYYVMMSCKRYSARQDNTACSSVQNHLTPEGIRLSFLRLAAVWCTALFTLSGPAVADDIVVAAASSLSGAFSELAVKYERQHPGTRVVTSFAASDIVQRQIVNGAPVDIFASADQIAMDRAAEAGAIVPGSRLNFARNTIVLIVPTDNPRNIESVSDLVSDSVTRVGVGNPDIVPAGRYARSALRAAGVWRATAQKRVLGQNVRQVLAYVARGEVDAGLVFATDAAIMPDKVSVVASFYPDDPVLYPIALVERPGRNPEAHELLAYIASDAGQAVLAKYGFAKP